MTAVINHDFRLLADILRQDGVEVLTTEGKIILCLHSYGSMKVKELMLATSASYRGFYLALDRLKEQGLVESRQCETDKRVRMVALSGKFGIEVTGTLGYDQRKPNGQSAAP